MEKEKYSGLQAEFVSFGDSDIGTVTIPAGYSGCEVGTIEVYVTQGDYTSQYYGCYYDDEDDIIFNWGSYGKRIG